MVTAVAIEPRDVLPLDGGLLVGRYCARSGDTAFHSDWRRRASTSSRARSPTSSALGSRGRASNTTEVVHGLDELLSAIGDPGRAYLLAPVDLQPIKAAGVTFVESMLERVIEEATAAMRPWRRRPDGSWRRSGTT